LFCLRDDADECAQERHDEIVSQRSGRHEFKEPEQ
jgi:hypothetical protein